jgi:hypothetical protein
MQNFGPAGREERKHTHTERKRSSEKINPPNFLPLFSNKLYSVQIYVAAQNYGTLHGVVQGLSHHIHKISNYRQPSSNKIMIQIKLLDMSMIFHRTELHLSEWNGL